MARKIDPAKREAILKAARMVFLRDGYDESRMSVIAAEASVAPGTLYLYFDSKEALASSIGEQIFARLIKEFAQVINGLGTPAGVDTLVEWSASIAAEERDLLKLIKMQAQKADKHAEVGPKQEFKKHLTNLLGHLMKTPGVRQYEAASLSEIVFFLLSGIFETCLYDESQDIERIKKATADVLKHALFEDSVLMAVKP
ncbi:MAG: TetR/AcrR family transcriptional regulator [Cyanobacteria bacterium REEB67]|nr:TetR/AcrR family transcriptional regulator [Cyanobacteria bacterium REEB67]